MNSTCTRFSKAADTTTQKTLLSHANDVFNVSAKPLMTFVFVFKFD